MAGCRIVKPGIPGAQWQHVRRVFGLFYARRLQLIGCTKVPTVVGLALDSATMTNVTGGLALDEALVPGAFG